MVLKKITSPRKAKEPYGPGKWVAVDPAFVLNVTKDGQIVVFGEKITAVELKNLQAEVKSLKQFRIWSIIQNTLKQKAIEKGFYEATDWEMALSGKMMAHSLGIIQSIVKVIDEHK